MQSNSYLRTVTGGGPPPTRTTFSKSPNGHLKLGQLPIPSGKSSAPRRGTDNSTNFPSPLRGTSYLTFNRFSRVHKRDRHGLGTIFVKLAPVDLKNFPVIPMSPVSNNGYGGSGSYGERDQDVRGQGQRNGMGGGGGSMITPGLGGIPGPELTNRFSRLWPNKQMGYGRSPGGSPTGGYSSSLLPNSSNILDALQNRKRGRDLDGSLNTSGNMTESNSRPGPSSPPKSSLMGLEDHRKFNKRVKYVTEKELSRLQHVNRPLSFDTYHQDLTPGLGEPPLNSRSILEQMNQTEKRFFPDATPVTSAPKRTKIFGSPPRPGKTSTPLPSTSTSGLRKREGDRDGGISMVEFDTDDEGVAEESKSKVGKFCHCNECYAEAAGAVVSTSPPQNSKKMVSFGETSLLGGDWRRSNNASFSSSTSTCDRGTGTDPEMEWHRPEIIIRKAIAPATLITKEKYDYDNIKRLERFKRILGLPPPKPRTSSSDDVMDGALKKPEESPLNDSCSQSTSTANASLIENKPAFVGTSLPKFETQTVPQTQPQLPVAPPAAAPSFNFGSGAPAETTPSQPAFQFGAPKEIPAAQPATEEQSPAPQEPRNSSADGLTDGAAVKKPEEVKPSTQNGLFSQSQIENKPLFGTTQPKIETQAVPELKPLVPVVPATTSFNFGSGATGTQPQPAAPFQFGSSQQTPATQPAPQQPTPAPSEPTNNNSDNIFGTVKKSEEVKPSSQTNLFGQPQSTPTGNVSAVENKSVFGTPLPKLETPAVPEPQPQVPVVSAATSFNFNAGSNAKPAFQFGSSSSSTTQQTPATQPAAATQLQTPSPAPSIFSLGTGNIGSQKPFQFGGTPTSATQSAPQQQTQAPAAPATGGFSFGGASSAGSQPSFQFGGTPQKPATQPATQQPTQPPVPGIFSLGAGAGSTGSGSQTPFQFGGTPSTQTAPQQQQTPAAGSFTLGGGSTGTQNPFQFGSSSNTQQTSATQQPSSVFSLGTGAGSSGTQNPFQFGGTSASQAASQPQQQTQAPATGGFNFGGGSSTGSQPTFQFGNTQPAPSQQGGFNFSSPITNNVPMGSQSATPFQFGGTPQTPNNQSVAQPQAPASGGFNFGGAVGSQPNFQFGAAQQSPAQGGFNFASQAGNTVPIGPNSPGGGNMFSLGTGAQATTPRRPRQLRRYR